MFGHIPEGFHQKHEEERKELAREQLRDQFAMAALPAMIARRHPTQPWSEVPVKAYIMADMMLEARKEKK